MCQFVDDTLNEVRQGGLGSVAGEGFGSCLPEAQIGILRGELRSGDFERRAIELEAQIGEGEAGPIVQDRMLAIPPSKDRPPIGGQSLGEMDRRDCKVGRTSSLIRDRYGGRHSLLLRRSEVRIASPAPLRRRSDLLRSIQPKIARRSSSLIGHPL